MPNPTPRNVAELARDAAAVAAGAGAGLEVVGAVGGEVFRGDTGAVLRPGSVTKLVTATAVMQCVDDGLLALDDEVSRWVPRIGGGIEVHHLLSHSSGIDAGDLFVDTGDDDDCLARYVALLDGLKPLFEPGRTCSYNNGGMVLAGHLLALVRGMTYEDAVQRFVFERAGMAGARFDPEHNGSPICSRAMAPAGGTLACTAEDLLRLATAPGLLRPDTAASMRTLRVTAPAGVVENCGFGLGWQIWRNPFGQTARHGGAYPGKAAMLVVDDERDAALAFMSPHAGAINDINRLLDDRGAVAVGAPVENLDAYVGRYRSQTMTIAVERNGEGLTLQLEPYPAMPIEPVDRSTFTLVGEPFAFIDFDQRGSPNFMRFRMRVQRRIA